MITNMKTRTLLISQKCCGLCPHHPILCDGRCLDCGAIDPPLFTGEAQSAQEEPTKEEPPHEFEAPTFPEWMREPISGKVGVGNASLRSDCKEREQPEETPALVSDLVRAGEVELMTGEHNSSTNAHVSHQPDVAPGRGGRALARQGGRKRRDTDPLAAKLAKKAETADGGSHLQNHEGATQRKSVA